VIAFLIAAGVHAFAASTETPPPKLAPSAVITKYQHAVAHLKEPRTFTVEYTLQQTGTRTLDQEHRIFRSGANERDETFGVNGTHPASPTVRIFRGHPYRYTVAALAPRLSDYAFKFIGSRKVVHHREYEFRATPRTPSDTFVVTRVTIEGVSFLPTSISFVTPSKKGRGTITFARRGAWWVIASANAQARQPAGMAREQINFQHWRFPTSLPSSTFAVAKPSLVTPAEPG
jgi:hypothetical protein